MTTNTAFNNRFLGDTAESIAKWHYNRGLISPDNRKKQMCKFSEEMLETWECIVNGDKEHLKEELGDLFVVWINLVEEAGFTADECARTAHNKISKRTDGRTINGTFVKKEDL